MRKLNHSVPGPGVASPRVSPGWAPSHRPPPPRFAEPGPTANQDGGQHELGRQVLLARDRLAQPRERPAPAALVVEADGESVLPGVERRRQRGLVQLHVIADWRARDPMLRERMIEGPQHLTLRAQQMEEDQRLGPTLLAARARRPRPGQA